MCVGIIVASICIATCRYRNTPSCTHLYTMCIPYAAETAEEKEEPLTLPAALVTEESHSVTCSDQHNLSTEQRHTEHEVEEPRPVSELSEGGEGVPVTEGGAAHTAGGVNNTGESEGVAVSETVAATESSVADGGGGGGGGGGVAVEGRGEGGLEARENEESGSGEKDGEGREEEVGESKEKEGASGEKDGGSGEKEDEGKDDAEEPANLILSIPFHHIKLKKGRGRSPSTCESICNL